MPLGPGRAGRGVVGAPVATAAVSGGVGPRPVPGRQGRRRRAPPCHPVHRRSPRPPSSGQRSHPVVAASSADSADVRVDGRAGHRRTRAPHDGVPPRSRRRRSLPSGDAITPSARVRPDPRRALRGDTASPRRHRHDGHAHRRPGRRLPGRRNRPPADFEASSRVAAKRGGRSRPPSSSPTTPDGKVTVQKTGDNLGRTGAKWGGSVGFLVGLAAPPLLAATVVGAAAGAVLGRVADHKMEQGLHDKLGEAMKPGTAAIIAMFDTDQRLAVEQALPGSPAKSVVPDRQEGERRPQGLPRRGDGQVQPGPLAPCPSPTAPSAAWPDGRSRTPSRTG